ncbi:MAG TPA: SigE family RNA polymerase sigma factor [Nocardioidaceae bacterium]|nr:SigE family RNA polymerase sigma factor [Nocardioidaceae bacterium]
MGTDEIDPGLAELCEREHARLVGLLALYTGDRAVGEDLAQETLLRLHQHWPRVRDMASPHAWLSSVGLNLARSWWRRRFAEQRAHSRLRRAPLNVPSPEPSDVVAIRSAVAALPPRERAALVLRYYGGLSVAETAEALGCAEGTVKSLTYKAVAVLRTTVDVREPWETPRV